MVLEKTSVCRNNLSIIPMIRPVDVCPEFEFEQLSLNDSVHIT
jgi:hypothetical protein